MAEMPFAKHNNMVKADWEAWNARSLAEEPIRRSSESRTIVRREFDELRELVHEPGDLASGRLMRPQARPAQLALARSSKPPQKQLPDVLFQRSSRPLLVQFAAE
jgi:hypothetical protein